MLPTVMSLPANSLHESTTQPKTTRISEPITNSLRQSQRKTRRPKPLTQLQKPLTSAPNYQPFKRRWHRHRNKQVRHKQRRQLPQNKSNCYPMRIETCGQTHQRSRFPWRNRRCPPINLYPSWHACHRQDYLYQRH